MGASVDVVDWAVSSVDNIQAVFKIKGDGHCSQEKTSAANLKEFLVLLLKHRDHVLRRVYGDRVQGLGHGTAGLAATVSGHPIQDYVKETMIAQISNQESVFAMIRVVV